MGFDTYSKCFNASISPILEYGAEIMGYHKGENIEQVQNKAIRVYLGVHRFAAIPAITGDTGWVPSSIKRKICMLRYWNRLCLLDEPRLTKRIFNHIFERQSTKWYKAVCNILSEIGLDGHFWNKEPCDLNICKTELMASHNDTWHSLVTHKPKLRTYMSLKQNYNTENYVKLNLERNQRSALAQLLAMKHNLEIIGGYFL